MSVWMDASYNNYGYAFASTASLAALLEMLSARPYLSVAHALVDEGPGQAERSSTEAGQVTSACELAIAAPVAACAS